MASHPRWCDHVAPVTAMVPCSGERHRVTWRRGKIVLEDHDLTAERTMAAFGGEPCFCMLVLKAWREQFGMPPELFKQYQATLGRDTSLSPEELATVSELAMALNWQRDWVRNSGLSKHGRLLQERLKVRAMGPLRQHLMAEKDRLGCRMLRGVTVESCRPGQPPELTGTMDTVSVRAAAVLDARWLVDVWARDLCVVDGAFVLEVEREEEGEPRPLVARAVRWERGADGVGRPVARLARIAPAGDGGPARLEWGPEDASVLVDGLPGLARTAPPGLDPSVWRISRR